ncbi:Scr1 family TA system antitoxin-like transcriptional regulator [Streptomyces sp. NPDC015130]|uniref:Scr1 family TA system antitoxin-like transcriptional regulator n=1 Tax=Streptomyces sp. NPDC015130 TaxID=3364940 RepID=UPI0036F7379D
MEYERSTHLRAWEGATVAGILQSADYARAVFTRDSELHDSLRDTDDDVRARLRRQTIPYEPGRTFDIVMWEAALSTPPYARRRFSPPNSTDSLA